MKSGWVLEGTGAAVLLLMPYMVPLLLPWNIIVYHHRLPITHLVGGILLDFAAVAVGAAAGIALLSRLPDVPRRIAAALLAVLVSLRFLLTFAAIVQLSHSPLFTDATMNVLGFATGIYFYWGRLRAPLLVLLLLGSGVAAALKPRWTRPVVGVVRTGLACLAFCSFWILPQMIRLGLASPQRPALAAMRAQAQGVAGERVVWVLFDELSYDLVFDHRPPGQIFPNFDRMRSQSGSLANVEPVGYWTDRIVPSLMVGRRIDAIRSTPEGQLSYFDTSRRRWQVYDPATSLFGVAEGNGWNPGVAGWYVPYCRTFGPVLAACSWTPGIQTMIPMETWGASGERSTVANALTLREIALTRIAREREKLESRRLEQNIDDYRSVMGHAAALIGNPEIHFVFVHLPVPHPPGYYDRRTHQLSAGGDYLDNLTLADETLGELRQEVENGPEGDRTTFILSSDHSWRVPMWSNDGRWTAEEERISGGRFDPRPVFLIHFAGQKEGWEKQEASPELVEHDIIAAILEGRIHTAEDLRERLGSMEAARGARPGHGAEAMGQ